MNMFLCWELIVLFRAVRRCGSLARCTGLPKKEIDQLEAGRSRHDDIHQKVFRNSLLVANFLHHLSIHAGDVLISDKPIHTYTATEMPPKGFATSQIDMFIAEKVGLFKLDILSQRGLGHIKDAVELVWQNRGVRIDITQVERFKKDKGVAAQLRGADTIGCFYIESPGMRQLLKKLRCGDYLTLVAASSIIRPGVSQSGMMKQYIYRFHNPTAFEYLHPKMEELLKETYGVMVYQEDVIKVAHHFGKLDMGEADVLRRAMSGKYRGHKHFEEIRTKYFANCKDEGYPDHITAEVWRQIESFGGYSFSKAHSASFAVESYQSLFLKTYYPMEFMVAVINNWGGFYSRELYFHELKRVGANLHLPCVNNSEGFTNIKGCEVYMGLCHILGMRQELMLALLEQRGKFGAFKHLQDFIERVRPEPEQVHKLIRIGAFRFTGKGKQALLWEADFLLSKAKLHATGNTLFRNEEPVEFELPPLHYDSLDDYLDQIELLGFIVGDPFEMADIDLSKFITACELEKHRGQEVNVIGYLITTKPVHTIKNEAMYFHTFLDQQGNWLDTVHFPQVASQYPIMGRGFYGMRGVVTEEFGVYSVEVHYCRKMGYKQKAEKVDELLKGDRSYIEGGGMICPTNR